MVQIAHVGDTDDLDYIEALLDTGCYIGMDRYGIGAGRLGTEARNATVLALLERGYGDRMMLGHDAVIRMDGWAPGQRAEERPDWHPTYIFETVLPELIRRGASEEALDAMLGANVRAWLSA
jgi:phosphotriesterase-related protein